MGRWAQAQRRGSVGPGETIAGISAPVFGVDWDGNNDSISGPQINCIAGAGPAGAVGIRAETRRPSGVVIATNVVTFLGSSPGGPVSGADTFGRAAWWDGAAQIGPWSAIVQLPNS